MLPQGFRFARVGVLRLKKLVGAARVSWQPSSARLPPCQFSPPPIVNPRIGKSDHCLYSSFCSSGESACSDEPSPSAAVAPRAPAPTAQSTCCPFAQSTESGESVGPEPVTPRAPVSSIGVTPGFSTRPAVSSEPVPFLAAAPRVSAPAVSSPTVDSTVKSPIITSDSSPSCLPVDHVAYAARKPEPEMLVPCVLGDDSFSFAADGLIDTGAGWNYLSIDESIRSQLQLIPCQPFPVEMADDSCVTIAQKVRLDVKLQGVEGCAAASIELYVFPDGSARRKAFVLLGRAAHREFGIHTSPGCAYIPTATPTCILFGSRDTARSASNCETASPDRILEWLVGQSWGRLNRAGLGYEFRLKELAAGDTRDVPEQTHCLQIRIPPPKTKLASADLLRIVLEVEASARGHMSRQSATAQAKASELIQGYVTQKFWRQSSREECARVSAHRPTPVFLIGGEGCGRKPRLVCDFRALNKELPPAGSSDRAPSHLMMALRLLAPSIILVGDAEQAFYKLRLEDGTGSGTDQIWLVGAAPRHDGRLDVSHFLCSRLAFGLAVGPTALISSMSFLMSYPCFSSFCGWYVDDLIIASSDPAKVHRDFTLINSLLSRVGHKLKPEKSALICHSSCTAAVSQLFSPEHPLAPQARVFGSELSYDGDSLNISCGDIRDKSSALAQLATVQVHTSSYTKKDFFQLAGLLGYDLVRAHAEVRVLADCWRSVIGRMPAPWNVPLDLRALPPPHQAVVSKLSEWSLELSAGILPDRPCRHQTSVASTCTAPESHITIHTDASSSGGAFLISHNGGLLWEEAFRWTKSRTRWHSNRLECSALLLATRCIADALQCLHSCSPSQRFQVTIFCDNRSSVSWAQTGNVNVGGKQQRRAMQRLIDSLAEEIKIIKGFADMSVVHLPGANNAHADLLSRCCERVQGLLEGGEPPTKSKSLEEIISANPDDTESDRELDGCEGMQELSPKGMQELSPTDEDHRIFRVAEHPSPPLYPVPTIISSLPAGSIVDFLCATVSPRPTDGLAMATASTPTAGDSWVERAAPDCYDVGTIARLAALMRFALKVLSWNCSSSGEPPPEYPIVFTADDLLAVGRSAQAGIAPSSTKFLFFDPGTQLWCLQEPLPSGSFKHSPFVPSSAPALQTKIILDAHRSCSHRGPDYTLAMVSQWSLERPHKRANQLIATCLHCQVKRARRGLNAPLMLFTDLTSLGPFESLSLDHLAIGTKSLALTSLCTVTGFTNLAYCASHSADDTWSALRTILHRIPRRPRRFLTDAAPVFGVVLERYQRQYSLPVEHRCTPAHSPNENGRLERAHGSALSILRTDLHLNKLSVEDSAPYEIQCLLDAVSYSLNWRPLGEVYLELHSANRFHLSPMVLVYGTAILDGTRELDAPPPPFPLLPAVLRKGYVNWRSFYDGYYWRRLKKRSAQAMTRRTKHVLTFAINEIVLFYSPTGSKSQLDYSVGVVRDIRGNQFRIESRGKQRTISCHNVTKLALRTDFPACPTDVNRVGAEVTVRVDGRQYAGTVVDEEVDGKLLVRWHLQDGTGWPDEYLSGPELTFV